MLTGKITVHEEPNYYSRTNYYENNDYSNYPYHNWHKKIPSLKEREEEVKIYASAAEALGFVVGAKVMRASGYGKPGTVTGILVDGFRAYNFQTGKYEVIQVEFIDHGKYVSTFSPDELNLIEKPETDPLPIVEELDPPFMY